MLEVLYHLAEQVDDPVQQVGDLAEHSTEAAIKQAGDSIALAGTSWAVVYWVLLIFD